MNILITGANGFIGNALTKYLAFQGHSITQIHRYTTLYELQNTTHDCMIHLAGRAHVLHETASDAYQAFKEVNVDYTLKIANIGQQLNIKKFIFLSSIGVNGQTSQQPFKESDTPQPQNDYARTKLEAELELKEFFKGSDTALTIIRPPLVYGPNPKANFKALLSLCSYPLPLPFAAIHNKRSLVGIDNLCNFINLCCQHPAAADQTFLIADDQDVSLTELITTIRKALKRPAYLLTVPEAWLHTFFQLLGKDSLSDQLLANLQLDVSKAKELLNWKPLISFDEGIKRAVTNHVT